MSDNEWLAIDVLEDYLDGKLDSKTMHRVEKISLDDPFVAQALAGLAAAKRRKQSLSILQNQLQQRVVEKPIEAKRWRTTSQRLSVAAVAAVLFLTVSVLFFMRENSRQQIAKNQPKKIDVIIAPQVADAKTTNQQPIDKSGNVAPSAVTMAMMDDALAAAKTTAIAKNKKISPNIPSNEATSKVVVVAAEAAAMQQKEVVVAAKQAAPLKDEQIQVAKNNTNKPTGESLVLLKGKADGVSMPVKMIQGRVIDKMTSLPLTSVTVMQTGTKVSATTDVNGIFKIPVEANANDLTLKFSYLGFKSQEVKIDPKKIGDIQLEPSNASLSEVVVVGYGKSQAKRSAAASTALVTSTPVDGWERYNQKLFSAIRESKVPTTPYSVILKLAFTVSPNGNPIDIKIIKSGGKEFDEAAIKILRNGGKWTYINNRINRAELEIKFSD